MSQISDKTFAEVGTLAPNTRAEQVAVVSHAMQLDREQGWGPGEFELVMDSLFAPVGRWRTDSGRLTESKARRRG